MGHVQVVWSKGKEDRKHIGAQYHTAVPVATDTINGSQHVPFACTACTHIASLCVLSDETIILGVIHGRTESLAYEGSQTSFGPPDAVQADKRKLAAYMFCLCDVFSTCVPVLRRHLVVVWRQFLLQHSRHQFRVLML